jgi:hypothetical protein
MDKSQNKTKQNNMSNIEKLANVLFDNKLTDREKIAIIVDQPPSISIGQLIECLNKSTANYINLCKADGTILYKINK